MFHSIRTYFARCISNIIMLHFNRDDTRHTIFLCNIYNSVSQGSPRRSSLTRLIRFSSDRNCSKVGTKLTRTGMLWMVDVWRGDTTLKLIRMAQVKSDVRIEDIFLCVYLCVFERYGQSMSYISFFCYGNRL